MSIRGLFACRLFHAQHIRFRPVAREAPNAGGKEDLFAKFQQKKQELYEKARADYIAKFVEGGSN